MTVCSNVQVKDCLAAVEQGKDWKLEQLADRDGSSQEAVNEVCLSCSLGMD